MKDVSISKPKNFRTDPMREEFWSSKLPSQVTVGSSGITSCPWNGWKGYDLVNREAKAATRKIVLLTY